MSSANEFLGAWVLVFCLVGPAAAVDIVSDAGHEGRGEGVPGITYPAVFSVKVQIGGGINSASTRCGILNVCLLPLAQRNL